LQREVLAAQNPLPEILQREAGVCQCRLTQEVVMGQEEHQ